jgi:cell division protein FtsL
MFIVDDFCQLTGIINHRSKHSWILVTQMAPEQFDDMPKIVLEKDDMESFQRSRGKTSKSSASSRQSPVEQTSSSSSRSPSWFAFIFLLLLIIAGAAYWSYEQYKVMLSAQSRIAELESRLSATGEEMDQSAVALQVKVTELSSKTDELWLQMDKLWASAWRQNQTDIKRASAALKTQGESVDKKLDTIQADINGSNASVVLLRQQLDAHRTSLSQVKGSSANVQQRAADLELQVEGLKERLISTALANNNLSSRIDDLSKKQKDTAKQLRILKAASPRTTASPEVF